MFKLAPKDNIKTKVNVTEPLDDGKSKQHSFWVRWKKLTMTEFKELNDRVQASHNESYDTEEKEVFTWFEALRENCVELGDLQDESGEPIPHSDQLVRQILDLQWCFGPMLESFIAIQTGQREDERRKNSQTRAKSGR